MQARHNDSTSVRFLNPPTLSAPPGYSHVVETRGGRTVYIAGQVALDGAGNLVGKGDFKAQAEQVFRNLQHALSAVGAEFRNVVKLGIYVTDFAELGSLREVRDRFIDVAHPPASTAVAVKRLFREEFLVEIEAIAVVPEGEAEGEP
jgi:enamine deaminase RidA (YjgF/YER057c/UK114 family)